MPSENKHSIIRNFFVVFFILAVFGFVCSVAVFLYYAGQIPDPSAIAFRRVDEATKIYDRTGENLLYTIYDEEKRTIIPWDQMPETVKKTTLTSEDDDFYAHKGIDFRAIIRALYKDMLSFSTSQGGSTITQQLVKNSILGKEKTLARKIKEAVLSVQIERKFTKDEIFWMYLNQIPYGSTIYGIEAASQAFFGKPAKNLTLNEAALLASLIKSPTYYSPYGNNFSELLERKNSILEKMKNSGMVSEDDFNQALSEELDIKPSKESISAPHFVIMVREFLIKKYGEDMVRKGGLKVVTTLDVDLQKIAEEAVKKYGEVNFEKYKAKNVALVAADPKTGKILAMVGSRDYFDIQNEGNFNVALGFRQPGSSFKPFVYATAFSKGFTDSTILFDLPTEFNPNCNPSANQKKDEFGQDCYNPQNYTGRFSGPVTMRQSLAQSLNVPSVKTLYLAGIDDSIDLAKKMGITTLNDRSRYGLSLVLGGGEVRLVDMVSAYGVFANDGIKQETSFIEKISTNDGIIIEENKKEEERVLDPQIARLITDILSDNNARSPVFGYNSYLYFPDRQVAAKTGTTQENRDGWLIGYIPSLVAGVWTGNNDNSSMTKEGAGLSAAGPIWHEFMKNATKGKDSEKFAEPDPIIADKIMLNGNYLSPEGIHSILYFVDKNNPKGKKPENPGRDTQFDNWEQAVIKRFSNQNSEL